MVRVCVGGDGWEASAICVPLGEAMRGERLDMQASYLIFIFILMKKKFDICGIRC